MGEGRGRAGESNGGNGDNCNSLWLSTIHCSTLRTSLTVYRRHFQQVKIDKHLPLKSQKRINKLVAEIQIK